MYNARWYWTGVLLGRDFLFGIICEHMYFGFRCVPDIDESKGDEKSNSCYSLLYTPHPFDVIRVQGMTGLLSLKNVTE